MDQKLEYILANTALNILSQNDTFSSYGEFSSGKLEVAGALTHIQQVKELLDLGLNPLAVTDCSDEKNPRVLLVEVMAHSDDIKVINLLVDYLNPQRLSHLPNQLSDVLLNNLSSNGNTETLTKLFERGFKLVQGHSDSAVECNLARTGNLNFFEILHHYQPDFNFNKNYGGMTLHEMVKEELPYHDAKGRQQMESLSVFLTSLARYTQLQENLPESGISESNISPSVKAKI